MPIANERVKRSPPLLTMTTALLGEKIRILRQRHQLSQAELADRLGGLSQSMVSGVETGQRQDRDRPSLDFVIRVALLFGVSVDGLLRDDSPIEPVHSVLLGARLGQVACATRFGSKLRALRRQRGWSLAQLAAQLGLRSRAYLSNLERGVKPLPSIESAVRIATLFDVTLDSLVRDDLEITSLHGA
ncbi:MAG: helix-turn-helix domain-containing protein [Chloroflexales bacterium]|nr:helix-turn-helix domain-containing protein [Chloroflexales bacterium]